MNIINGEKALLLRELNISLTTIYFILNPMPYMLWSLYIDFYIHKSIRRVRKLVKIIAISSIISIILCIFSLFNKGVFYIDENNFYRRGHLFLLNAVFYYLYYIIVYGQLIYERKNIRKGDLLSILSFGILPAIAGVIQTLNTNKAHIWLAISFSCLIIYLNIQNSEINQDYLTGLYNRRQLDMYLRNSIKNYNGKESLLLIMIDIDFFKEINDFYGHMEGDSALKYTADILVDSFRSEDFISRYGGDEFVIIVKYCKGNCSESIVNRLKANFQEFNKLGLKPYEMNISIGWGIYDLDLNMTADEFIMHVDQLMYKDKNRMDRGMDLNCANNII